MDWSKWEDEDMKALIHGVIHAIEEGEQRIKQSLDYADMLDSTNPVDAKAVRMSAKSLENYVNLIRKPLNNYVTSYLAYEMHIENNED